MQNLRVREEEEEIQKVFKLNIIKFHKMLV